MNEGVTMTRAELLKAAQKNRGYIASLLPAVDPPKNARAASHCARLRELDRMLVDATRADLHPGVLLRTIDHVVRDLCTLAQEVRARRPPAS